MLCDVDVYILDDEVFESFVSATLTGYTVLAGINVGTGTGSIVEFDYSFITVVFVFVSFD